MLSEGVNELSKKTKHFSAIMDKFGQEILRIAF